MMDQFDKKQLRPMLIGSSKDKAFDSPDFLYELKLDGERCLAYLDSNETVLINRSGRKVLDKLPELTEIHKQAKEKVIIDGELIIMKKGKPDFELIKNRILSRNKYRIKSDSRENPVSFVAFDILYKDGCSLIELPLRERRELLIESLIDGKRLSVSRAVEGQGVSFFDLTVQNDLEGIIAKKLDSLYYPGKRSKDWMRIKNIQDDEFFICGYILRNHKIASLILGQYNENQNLTFRGRVTISKTNPDLEIIFDQPKVDQLFEDVKLQKNEAKIWIKPNLVCTVEYLQITDNGRLRQPIYKGLRQDKM